MLSKSKLAFGAIILSALLWSAVGPLMKILYQAFDPFPLAFIRFTIASLIILPFFIRKSLPKISKSVILTMLFSSGNIFFFYLGIEKTTVMASSVIYAATTLVVAVLSNFIINEKLTWNKILGIVLGFLGVTLIILLPTFKTGQASAGDLTGNILIVLAVLSWSFYTIGSRYLTNVKKYSPLSLSTLSFLTSAVIFGILTFLAPHQDFMKPLTQFKFLSLVIYLAIFATVITFILYQWAIKYSSATTASLNNYVQPVFAIILSMILIGEKLTWEFVIGSLIVMAGLAIFSSHKMIGWIKR